MEVRHARFVTGASGWIGSALVPELIGAAHEVTGLARSDASAAALNPVWSTLTRELLGWQPTHPGLIEDLDKGHYFHGRSA
jgi:nucleoside-diphosphate-sugar epimerase